VQQEKCNKKSVIEKVCQEKCGKKIAEEKVRQEKCGRKSVAKKLQQEKCNRRTTAEIVRQKNRGSGFATIKPRQQNATRRKNGMVFICVVLNL
jgi:hypothetical protein